MCGENETVPQRVGALPLPLGLPEEELSLEREKDAEAQAASEALAFIDRVNEGELE